MRPLMIGGRAAGRRRSGYHVRGNGARVSRIGLTVQQLMGLSVASWGARSLEVSQPIGAILTQGR